MMSPSWPAFWRRQETSPFGSAFINPWNPWLLLALKGHLDDHRAKRVRHCLKPDAGGAILSSFARLFLLWEQCLSGSAVAVANGDRQSVRGVIRGRYLWQVQQKPDHHLYLAFLRAPVADERAFNLEGRVLVHRESLLSGDQKHYTAGMPQLECRLNVGRIKHPLDRNGVDRLSCQNFPQLFVDLEQAFMKGAAFRSPDCAKENGGVSGSVRLDETVSGDFAAGIDSQDSHRKASSRSFLESSLIDIEV